MFANSNDTYTVVLIDIDYTIRFCLRFTKPEMDQIMNGFLEFFRQEVPQEALISKSDGDEFFLFLPGMGKHVAKPYVDKVRKAFKKIKFARALQREFSNVTFSFSAGVATYPLDGKTFQEVKRTSLTCLFLAKAFRRNRVIEMPERRGENAERIFADPRGKIKVLLGCHGEIGHIGEPVNYDKARLWEPQAIDVDEVGNLYIVDQNNHTIVKCDGRKAFCYTGNGSYGYWGDGLNRRLAGLNKPTGLCVVGRKLYITDTGNDAVRVVDLDTEIIKTFAGCQDAGYTGDGRGAVMARLNKPGGVAADRKGNVYINDIANNVIRKVDAAGIITTFAGSGQYGYTGDGDLAINASFGEIYGLCIDKKTDRHLYLADYFNHCIRAIDLETNRIETIAGKGTAGYSGDGGPPHEAKLNRPVALCTDPLGNLFVAESGNHCVRVIASRTGTMLTIAGTGEYGVGSMDEIADVQFANPNGLAVDHNACLYILDGANNRVCLFDYRKLL